MQTLTGGQRLVQATAFNDLELTGVAPERYVFTLDYLAGHSCYPTVLSRLHST